MLPIEIPQMARIDEICKKTTLSKNTIRNLIEQGQFPKPIKLSKRTKGWKVKEINMYINGEWILKDENNEIIN